MRRRGLIHDRRGAGTACTEVLPLGVELLVAENLQGNYHIADGR